MSAVLILIGLSIITQAVAAAAALRLHWVYGHRWAWGFISAAILLMTVRRCITFYRIYTGDTVESVELDEPGASMASSILALLISSLLLAGVGLIEPLFRDIRRAEELLRGQNESLESVVRSNETEFRVARQIQLTLFPKDAPKLAGFDIAGASLPALYAGGDLYDYLQMPDGGLGIVVADVSGHGVGSAMFMAETRAYLRAISSTASECGDTLTLLNRYLCKEQRDSRFVTCFMAKLDAECRSLTYASAGHEAYIIDEMGQTHTLASKSPPLGLIEDARYESISATAMTPGSLLAIVTDGILESQSPEREMYGSERLLGVVSNHTPRSARDIITSLHHEIGEFTKGAPQSDDMTVVVIRAC